MAKVMNKSAVGIGGRKPTAKVTYKDLGGGMAAKVVAKPRTGSGTKTSGTKTATLRKKH